MGLMDRIKNKFKKKEYEPYNDLDDYEYGYTAHKTHWSTYNERAKTKDSIISSTKGLLHKAKDVVVDVADNIGDKQVSQKDLHRIEIESAKEAIEKKRMILAEKKLDKAIAEADSRPEVVEVKYGKAPEAPVQSPLKRLSAFGERAGNVFAPIDTSKLVQGRTNVRTNNLNTQMPKYGNIDVSKLVQSKTSINANHLNGIITNKRSINANFGVATFKNKKVSNATIKIPEMAPVDIDLGRLVQKKKGTQKLSDYYYKPR